MVQHKTLGVANWKYPVISLIVLLAVVVTMMFALWSSETNKRGELLKIINNQQRTIDSLIKRDSIYSKIVFKRTIEKRTGVDIPEHFSAKHLDLVVAESKKNSVPLGISLRLINKESRFNVNAKSSCGALGLMQIMPVTFRGYLKKLGLKPEFTPENNIKTGIFYLGSLHRIWVRKGYNSKRDAWILALASYNTGIGNVGLNPQYHLSPKSYTGKYSYGILS